VLVVGTTAKITAKNLTVAQVEVPLGGQNDQPVIVEIDYTSGDATILNVDVGPSQTPNPPPPGVTIHWATAMLRPNFIKGVNPINPRWDALFLSPFRSGKVAMTISADANKASLGTKQAFIEVYAPDFPGLNKSTVMVTFAIVRHGGL
jgi:hypothetical protein